MNLVSSGRRRVSKASAAVKDAVEKLDLALKAILNGKAVSQVSKEIWAAYMKTEYAVVMLKLHIGEENPERSPVQASLQDKHTDTLVLVCDTLSLGLKRISSGDIGGGLEEVRKCRDVLKVMLAGIRRGKV